MPSVLHHTPHQGRHSALWLDGVGLDRTPWRWSVERCYSDPVGLLHEGTGAVAPSARSWRVPPPGIWDTKSRAVVLLGASVPPLAGPAIRGPPLAVAPQRPPPQTSALISLTR